MFSAEFFGRSFRPIFRLIFSADLFGRCCSAEFPGRIVQGEFCGRSLRPKFSGDLFGRVFGRNVRPKFSHRLHHQSRTSDGTEYAYTDWDDLSRFKMILKGVGWFGLIWDFRCNAPKFGPPSRRTLSRASGGIFSIFIFSVDLCQASAQFTNEMHKHLRIRLTCGSLNRKELPRTHPTLLRN